MLLACLQQRPELGRQAYRFFRFRLHSSKAVTRRERERREDCFEPPQQRFSLLLWLEEAASGISCMIWVGLLAKSAVLVRFIRKTRAKIQNMAEMSWVEQLRQYNARHAKDKAGKLS